MNRLYNELLGASVLKITEQTEPLWRGSCLLNSALIQITADNVEEATAAESEYRTAQLGRQLIAAPCWPTLTLLLVPANSGVSLLLPYK